jgi:hypothetical protein
MPENEDIQRFGSGLALKTCQSKASWRHCMRFDGIAAQTFLLIRNHSHV